MNYAHGLREGESKRFYENDKLYQTTEYRNNLINGLRKKYRENGKLISEIKYEENEPCLGLKEFLIEGDFKKYYPTIIITPADEIAKRSKYIINISMSNGDKNAEFYAGYLTDSGCLHRGLDKILTDKTTGVGTISYDLKPNQVLDLELNIIAVVKTMHGNPYVTQNRINILYKR